jgi:hypothetical protein
VAAALSLFAAFASLLRGDRSVHLAGAKD